VHASRHFTHTPPIFSDFSEQSPITVLRSFASVMNGGKTQKMKITIRILSIIVPMLIVFLVGCTFDVQASRPGENLSVKFTASNRGTDGGTIPVLANEGR
jgi:hypothetical protein